MKTVTCDFSRTVGTIRPEHGICQTPTSSVRHAVCSFDSADAELAESLFEEMGCPIRRMRGLRGMYGKSIDVPYVFRDFSKDPEEQTNYYFFRSDAAMSDAAACSETIMYHLGAPYEYWKPIYSVKPADYEKFADICLHLVRHYNDGWANGFHYGIRYWEIWHRADDPQCWSGGDFEDYYRLYEVTARRIKDAYPGLRVGGPAAAECGGDNTFLKGFLAYITKNKVPCDFVSWNYYGEDPAEALRQAREVKRLVRAAGLPRNVEIVNDEWNCMHFDENLRFDVKNVGNAHGAAFDAAFMMNMQKAGMDFCTYYGAEAYTPWNGLVDFGWIRPLKPLYAFTAFAKLYRLGTEVHTAVRGNGTTAMAATNGKKSAVLISVYAETNQLVEIRTGLPGEKTVFVLDDDHDLCPLYRTQEETICIPTEGYTVLLVEQCCKEDEK